MALLTATRPILLSGASDHQFREFLYNYFTVANRLVEVRRHLGSRIGLSGPQFSLLMAVAELQGAAGVSVGDVAAYLHVSGTFVTVESGKLARQGHLHKSPDPEDRRVSLLRLDREGRNAMQTLLPDVQQINDLVFDLESRDQFEALCAAFARMVETSRRALAVLETREQETKKTSHRRGDVLSL
jgi:MarR family transcriptional regulator, organic hydroperoxide resistance regulator